MMQSLTQKTEPQNFSRAADIARGRRNGSSFLSLCPTERPGQMLGIKVPSHPQAVLGQKTLMTQSYLLTWCYCTTLKTKAVTKRAWEAAQLRREERKTQGRDQRGDTGKSQSHCRTPQPLLRNHSLDQCTPTDTNSSGPAKDITLRQQIPLVRSMNANKKSSKGWPYSGWCHRARGPMAPAVPLAWESAVSSS